MHGISLALTPSVRRIVLLLILSTSLACGCAATQPSASNSYASIAPWVRRCGGVVTGPENQRVTHALAAISAVLGPGTHLRASVLNSSKPAAYAWPDGSLFVTRGLMDQLDDAELTAALAHEAGHLLADQWVNPPAGLRGDGAPPECESHADFIGCRILRAANIPPSNMSTLLHKIRAATPAHDPARPALDRRIRLLESRPD